MFQAHVWLANLQRWEFPVVTGASIDEVEKRFEAIALESGGSKGRKLVYAIQEVSDVR